MVLSNFFLNVRDSRNREGLFYFVVFLNKVIYFCTRASLLLHGQSVGETIPCLLGLNLLRQIFKTTKNEGPRSVTRKELATNASDWSKSYQQETIRDFDGTRSSENTLTHFFTKELKIKNATTRTSCFCDTFRAIQLKVQRFGGFFNVSKMIYCKYTNANMYDISSAV